MQVSCSTTSWSVAARQSVSLAGHRLTDWDKTEIGPGAR